MNIINKDDRFFLGWKNEREKLTPFRLNRSITISASDLKSRATNECSLISRTLAKLVGGMSEADQVLWTRRSA